MGATEKLRLFVGLWPDADTRDALQASAGTWSWPAGARCTPPERLHLTVHFLGAVPADRLAALREALRVPWSGCVLEFDRAMVWPGGIAVLEASRVPAALADLHGALAARLPGLGLPVDPRPWRPHVTLARKAAGAHPPAQHAALRWPAGPQVLLVQSLPGGGGYVPLASLA
jgi:2'-5' RNA ligase